MNLPSLPEELLLPLVFAALAAVFLVYRIYTHSATLKVVERLLKAYYNDKGIEVITISPFKTVDKLKYGVPLNPYVSFYTSTFSFFTAGNERFYRMVETSDPAGHEHLRYVEISLLGNTEISVNEFETYEF